jgi:hypothetical protein
MGKKSGDTVPSRYLDSKFKKVTQEIKHYRYHAQHAYKNLCAYMHVNLRCQHAIADTQRLTEMQQPSEYRFNGMFAKPLLFSIYNDTRQKIIKSQVNKLAFFSCCPVSTASSFLITSLSGWGGGGCTWPGGEGGCTCLLCIPPGYATGSNDFILQKMYLLLLKGLSHEIDLKNFD